MDVSGGWCRNLDVELKELVRSKSKGILHNTQRAVILETSNISRAFKVATWTTYIPLPLHLFTSFVQYYWSNIEIEASLFWVLKSPYTLTVLPCFQQVNLKWAHNPINFNQLQKKYVTSMSCKFEPAIWSCDIGQQIPCFDRCQLIITQMANMKEVHGKPRLHVSVNLSFGVRPPFTFVTWRPYCLGRPKKLCFTTQSLAVKTVGPRLSVVKQSFFGLLGQYGRRVTKANVARLCHRHAYVPMSNTAVNHQGNYWQLAKLQIWENFKDFLIYI